jgi:3-methyl-2-oxobutanoate hydroxymethyltransferase
MNDAVDIILVGDSVGMVVLGHPSTVPVTLDDMVHHTKAVARGAHTPLLVADMPFGSYTTPDRALSSAVRLVQEGGAHGVKLEGGVPQSGKISALVREGFPVMAHVGLLPQTAPLVAGYALRGKTSAAALACVDDALSVESSGAFSVVLEMVPDQVAAFVSGLLRIPTIGIGAGPHCGGQVLVAHDMLGMMPKAPPKFVRKYAELNGVMRAAFSAYAEDVHSGRFPRDAVATTAQSAQTPAPQHQYFYDMPVVELEAFQRAAHSAHPSATKALAALDAAVAEGLSRAGAASPGVQAASTASRTVSDSRAPPPASAPVTSSSSSSSSSSSRIVLPPTSSSSPRVAILGSGAVASLVAAKLSQGTAVTMFSHWEKRLRDVQDLGIQWRERFASASGPGTVVQSLLAGAVRLTPSSPAAVGSEHAGQYDFVFLCGKAHQVGGQAEVAARLIRPGSGSVVPLYNGHYTHEYLRATFRAGSGAGKLSASQVAYGQTSFGARFAEGEGGTLLIEHTGPGRVRACFPSEQAEAAFRSTIAPLLPATAAGEGSDTLPFADMETLRWSKLAVNALLNPVVSLLGVDNGAFVAAARSGPFARTIETLSVGVAAAARTATSGCSTPLKWSGADVLDAAVSVATQTAANTNSMLVDARHGRPTEAQFITGAVVDVLEGRGKASSSTSAHAASGAPADAGGEAAESALAHREILRAMQAREMGLGVFRDDVQAEVARIVRVAREEMR